MNKLETLVAIGIGAIGVFGAIYAIGVIGFFCVIGAIVAAIYMYYSRINRENELNHNRPLDEIVQDLNNKINLLTQSKRDLKEKISKEEARANTNNKRVALQALKRKRKYEFQINQIGGMINTLIHHRRALQNAPANREVLNNLFNQSQGLVEQNAVANKIANIMQNNNDDEFDDDELLDEL